MGAEVRIAETPAAARSAGFVEAWRDLARAAGEPAPFCEPWFLLPSLDHLAREGGVRLLSAWDGDRMIGLAPVAIGGRYGRLPVRHVANWQHHHNFLGTPLLRAGAEEEAWGLLLDALDKAPWACGLLHYSGLVEDGPVHAALTRAARSRGKPCDTVYRIERALLHSALTADAYLAGSLRGKKRKELRRQAHRLSEVGTVDFVESRGEDGAMWADAFLALESAGWKGRAGSALIDHPETDAFFRAMLDDAAAHHRLQILAMRLEGRPIAMLVNILTPPGSFSYKIAYDEDFARFSPGVLLQIENLERIQAMEDVAWMDSCAVENHSMINSLWTERRRLVRVTLPLAGWRRSATFHLCRTMERAAALRRLAMAPSAPRKPAEAHA